ncbi:MAG: type II secretion system F family protein [Chloroflexota bacterium]
MDWLAMGLATGAAASVVLVVSGGYVVRAEAVKVRTRLDEFAARPRTLEELELSQPLFDRVVRPGLSKLSDLLARRRPEHTLAEVRHKLAVAGNPKDLEAADFLGLKALAAFLLAALALLIVFSRMTLLMTLGITAACAVVGYMLPDLWLSRLISARKKEISRALPDALDLLTISVEAGLGFDAAMNKVAQKWKNALSSEFGRTLAEIRMGKGRRDALRDLCGRTDVGDMNTVIAAVIQADQLGVSIAKILRIQAEQMRVVRRQRAEQEAHQAPIKMTFPLVFLIFPAMLVVILGPALLQIGKTLGNGF